MPDNDRFPPQIKFIVGNEACERFSFYGMSSILVAFMISQLHFADHDAEFKYHAFVSACYFTPLVGGFIADRFFGKYRTILWLSLGYLVGHALIAAFDSLAGFYGGLFFIACGAGGIKPNVSAFVGDQFRRDQGHLMEKVYGLFYWTINIGSVSSFLVIPKLLVWYGPRVAFGVPGVLMALSLIIFYIGRRDYISVPPTGPSPHSFTKVLAAALLHQKSRRPGQSWLDVARVRHPGEAVDAAAAALRVMKVFLAVIAFWALFFQYGSSWILQGNKLDPDVLGLTIEPSQMQSLDAVFVLVLIPILTYGPYRWLERRGVAVTALRRMAAGMFITVLSFVCAALLEHAIAAGTRPSIGWQVPQYFFLGLGEVLVSATALEFAYTQAPRSMKSTIMSFWFLTITEGNLLTAYVAKVNRFQGPPFFWFFAGLMLVGAIVFALVAARYRPVELREDTTGAPPRAA